MVKRLAILYAGDRRNYPKCFPTFRFNTDNLKNEYVFDTFISCWNQKTSYCKRPIQNVGTFEDLIKLYKPISYDFPIYDQVKKWSLYKETKLYEFQKFISSKRACDESHKKDKCRICGGGTILNEIGMFWHIKNVNHLKTDYENLTGFKYDVVMRIRFDCYFYSQLTEQMLEEIDDSTILIPEGFDGLDKYGRGPNDQIALGNSRVMNLYSRIYDNMYKFSMDNYLKPHGYGGPHLWIKNQMDKYGIKIKRIPLRYCLDRKQGAYDKQIKAGVDYKDIRV